MQVFSDDPKKDRWLAGTTFLVILILLAWHFTMPKLGLEARGEQTWIRIVFLLILYVYINLAGFGLGRLLLQYFGLALLTKTETVLLEYLLGFGCLSAGVMILGFVGWLNAGAIFFWLALAGVIASIELARIRWPAWTVRFPGATSPYVILLQILLLLAVPLLLVECLLPVWDYDALFYHLEVPRQFL